MNVFKSLRRGFFILILLAISLAPSEALCAVITSSDGDPIFYDPSSFDPGSLDLLLSLTPTVRLSLGDILAGISDLGVGQQMMGHVNRQLSHSSLPKIRLNPGFRASPFVGYTKGSDSVSGGVEVAWQHDSLTISSRFGALTAEDDVRYAGETSYDGFWYSLGFTSQLGELGLSWLSGIELSVSVQAGDNNGEVDRKYYYGGILQTSTGDTDLDSLTTLARIGWSFELAKGLAMTPYFQVLHNETTTESYQEKGGSMPGYVHEQKDTALENSFGLSLNWQLTEKIGFTAWGALVDMHNDSGSDIIIDIDYGLGIPITIVSPGVEYDESWVDFGMGASWQLTNTINLQAKVGGTDGSNYPEDWYTSLGFSYLF